MKISYNVPAGFSAADLEGDARYLATFNGNTLPDFISISRQDGKLTFNRKKYLANGVNAKDISTLLKIFEKFDYQQCHNGCDLTLEGYRVSVDKVKRTITIRDANSDYIVPATNFGLVHNQSVDLRASSESYRAMNINGNAWLGLPSQSFGFLSWYASRTERENQSTDTQGVSSWYMQKNFADIYVRTGKQNSVDYSSGSISTLLTSGFNQFFTVGSQTHLLSNPNKGSLVLYATSEGNYEFYRNGRMLLKRPAVLGRNEIDFSDLPGGYYPLEIRLVDHNGRLIKKEEREVNNVNFGSGQNAWSLTAGRETQSNLSMLQASWSQDMRWFFMNTSVIRGGRGKWAAELNLTRTMVAGLFKVVPTLGLLSGEKKTGGYVSINASSDKLGTLSLSRYQNNQVSHFYAGSSSTSLTYSYLLKGAMLSYSYRRFSNSEQQQAEVRWNYRPNGLWANFALGVQKGGYQQSAGNYGVYLNTSWTLNNSQASFSAARSGGQTQLSGDYRKSYDDDFGKTTAGTTVNRIGNDTNVNMYANRSGTRGDASINVGHDKNSTNADFNYRGMVAANSQGIALGNYSYSGAAMILETPKIEALDYGFSVEGAPVAGGHRYAVPLKQYTDIPFAQVMTRSNDMDMNIEIPANIVRSHPGQVYNAKATVDINLLYNGFMKTVQGQPVSGVISETGDNVYQNGLFSIASKGVLQQVTVDGKQGSFRCDLTKPKGNDYQCLPLRP
ncbi:TcfC E-set like domain-containing protein [Erwinia rhapontici]|uniref:TcfC E-set like domain-containing protein n=1 Tax=Erwinia rhapontici TaxID=55212 RepID=UPI001D0DA876|nr:TcfC E-set like domain-containing protein [Erwinia rhapontici]UDQ80056.1 TcfC E-set like domain-containing protein [Erwinia rhapontici]